MANSSAKIRATRSAFIVAVVVGVLGWVVWSSIFAPNRFHRSATARSAKARAAADELLTPSLLSDAKPGLSLDGVTLELGDPKDKPTGYSTASGFTLQGEPEIWHFARTWADFPPVALTRVSHNDDPEDPWTVALSSGQFVRLSRVWLSYATSADTKQVASFRPGEKEPFEQREVASKASNAKGRIEIGVAFETDSRAWAHKDFIEAHDAQTLEKIKTSGGSGGKPGSVHFHFDARHWHDGPINFAFDIANGSPVEILVDPSIEGQALDLGQGMKGRLIRVLPGRCYGAHVTSDAGVEETTMVIDHHQAEGHCTVLLALSHPNNSFGYYVEPLDDSGEVIGKTGYWYHRANSFVKIEVPLEKIHRLRFRAHQHFDRVIFRLPRLPGTPDSNRDLDNLFDSRVPYFRPESQNDLVGQIRGMTQLHLPAGASFPPGYFPREFKNASALDLMREFEAHSAEKPFGVDLANGIIAPIQEPAWKLKLRESGEKLRAWFE